VLASNSLIY